MRLCRKLTTPRQSRLLDSNGAPMQTHYRPKRPTISIFIMLLQHIPFTRFALQFCSQLKTMEHLRAFSLPKLLYLCDSFFKMTSLSRKNKFIYIVRNVSNLNYQYLKSFFCDFSVTKWYFAKNFCHGNYPEQFYINWCWNKWENFLSETRNKFCSEQLWEFTAFLKKWTSVLKNHSMNSYLNVAKFFCSKTMITMQVDITLSNSEWSF